MPCYKTKLFILTPVGWSKKLCSSEVISEEALLCNIFIFFLNLAHGIILFKGSTLFNICF